MLRVAVGAVTVSLALACTHPSPPEPDKQDTPRVEPPKLSPIHPTDFIELGGGASAPPVDLGNGQMAHSFGPIFMKDSLSKAKLPVNLHTRGISIAPDSEAELYLATPDGQLIRYAYIGAITTGADGPSQIAEVVHEVKGNARDELRSMAHFGIVMVVTKGDVKVERFILSVSAK